MFITAVFWAVGRVQLPIRVDATTRGQVPNFSTRVNVTDIVLSVFVLIDWGLAAFSAQ